jgi:hypothetical protein
MAVATLIPVEEYLETSYSPAKKYRDGVLVERNLGDIPNSSLPLARGSYCYTRRKQWKIHVYTELRVKAREKWYPIPDVCVYALPVFEEGRAIPTNRRSSGSKYSRSMTACGRMVQIRRWLK